MLSLCMLKLHSVLNLLYWLMYVKQKSSALACTSRNNIKMPVCRIIFIAITATVNNLTLQNKNLYIGLKFACYIWFANGFLYNFQPLKLCSSCLTSFFVCTEPITYLTKETWSIFSLVYGICVCLSMMIKFRGVDTLDYMITWHNI